MGNIVTIVLWGTEVILNVNLALVIYPGLSIWTVKNVSARFAFKNSYVNISSRSCNL